MTSPILGMSRDVSQQCSQNQTRCNFPFPLITMAKATKAMKKTKKKTKKTYPAFENASRLRRRVPPKPQRAMKAKILKWRIVYKYVFRCETEQSI